MYARELIALKPDVLFASTNTSMAALHAEGSTIPTVFAMVTDPVTMHYVDSFPRPGRNVTGFTPFEPSLGGKWVSILKEVAPKTAHIGVVYNPEPGNNSAAFRDSIDQIAKSSGITSVNTPSGDSSGIDRLIVSLKNKPNSGLIFLPDAITSVRRAELTAMVAQCRLPAITRCGCSVLLADLFRTESMSTRFTRERRPTLIDYCGALIRANCLCKHQLSFS